MTINNIKLSIITKLVILVAILSLGNIVQAQEVNKDSYLKTCLVNLKKDEAMAGSNASLEKEVHDDLEKKCSCYSDNIDYKKMNSAITAKDDITLLDVEAKAKYMCNKRTDH